MDQLRRTAMVVVALIATACTAAPTSSVPSIAPPTATSSPAPTPTVKGSPAESPTTTAEHQVPAIGSASMVAFVDPFDGFLGGTGGIWATSDAGARWRRIWTGAAAVVSLDAVDTEHIWASVARKSGANAHLIGTIDGGEHWRILDRGRVFGELSMVSPSIGWAIAGPASSIGAPFLADPGMVDRTTDGGATWRPAGITAQSVCAVDARTAWVASGSIVRQSLDAGQTWTTHRLFPRGSFYAGEIGCADASSAWDLAIGDASMSQQPYIASKTSDGGVTWTPLLHEAYFPSPAGVTGFRGQIDAYSGPFAVPSSEAALFFGWSPAVGTVSVTDTVDGGASFDHTRIGRVHERHEAGPLSVSFINGDDGWLLVGMQGEAHSHLWHTSNGGTSWTQMPFES